MFITFNLARKKNKRLDSYYLITLSRILEFYAATRIGDYLLIPFLPTTLVNGKDAQNINNPLKLRSEEGGGLG